MKLALAQLQIAAGDIETNLNRATTAITEATKRGCELVCLPEIFTVGYFAFEDYRRAAEPVDGATITGLQEVAAAEEIAILAGSIVEDLAISAAHGFGTPASEGYANTAVYIDATGTRKGVYRKHHLFGYESAERELLTPGESLETVEDYGFTIGMTTCYDLRFPELYRELVERGVTLTLVPSAWPYPRLEHWQVLSRARAIENLMYVAVVNGVGEFDETSLLGRSAVYDPWGTAISNAGKQETVPTATIDPTAVADRRTEFPALTDRRT